MVLISSRVRYLAATDLTISIVKSLSSPLSAPSEMGTKPAAPYFLARFISSSCWLLLYPPQPGAEMALIAPPWAATFLKTPKAEEAPISVISASSIPKRRSGLSQPYFSIASAKLIRGNFLLYFISGRTLATSPVNRSSMSCIMSFSSTKLISISSWVNSGWRSALKSSSRKQRAT
ncbi:MAG: hypothetical protein JMHAAFGB_00027 [Dehalococcoides mccartyi]|nr:hypothetical protein [Dehalococcoides mccartyi]